MTIAPLFRWAGGKKRYVQHIAPYLTPSHTYVEPFFGGGAVFCYAVNQSLAENFVINDVNAEIMGIYSAIQTDPKPFIEKVRDLESRYLPLDKANRKIFYYVARTTYWHEPSPHLLFFLLKTSFNGIWQTCVESKGLFGTPCGLLNEKTVIDSDAIVAWHEALKKVQVLNTDFANVPVPNGSTVYADPPYRDTFTSYGTGFNDADQIRTVEWCRRVHADTGSTVVLSNKSDGSFFENLLTDEETAYFNAKHTAGRKNKPDGTYGSLHAKEMLVVWRDREPI